MISNETPYRIIMYRSGMMQLKHNCTITYSPMTFMIFATQTKCKRNFSCRRWQQISITLQPLHTELQCPMRYSSRTIWIFHNYLINNDKIRIHCDLLPVSRELCILAKNVLATYTETATSSASESDRANNSDFISIRFVDISSCSDWLHRLQLLICRKSRGMDNKQQISDACFVHLLRQYFPNAVINWIQIWWIWRSQ